MDKTLNSISKIQFTYWGIIRILTLALLPSSVVSKNLFIDAISSAYDTSSYKKATYENFKSKRASTYLTISDYLPSVKGTGELWQHNDELISDKYKEQEYLIGGKLIQPIVDIEKISNIVEARKNLHIEIENRRINNQNTLRSLILKWVEFSHKKTLYDLSYFADSLSELHLEATKKRFESGDLTKTDIFQAQSRFYNNRSSLEKDSISYSQSKALFISEYKGLEVDSIKIPKLKKLNFDKTIIDSLINNLPELKILKEQYKIAKARLVKSTLRNIPKLNAIGEISRNWDKSITYKPYPYNDMSIGLELSVPLWESGKTVAGVISANAIKKEEEIILTKVSKEKIIEVKNSILEIDKYQSQLTNFKLSKEALEKSFEGITIEFNIGNRSSIDVLNTQSELIDVIKEYEKSRKISFLTYIDFFYILGILNIETLKEFIIQEDS